MEHTGRFIDAHIHFWDRATFRYPWLEEADGLPFRFTPEDLRRRSDSAAALVFVQADCVADQGVAEATWAAEHVRSWGPGGAVVAFAPVDDVDRLPSVLEQLGTVPEVTGIRRLLQDEPDDLLRSTALAAGLRRVAEAGLTFDACVRHGQLPALIALRRAAPDGELVLDHLGKPPVAAGWGTPVAEAWHGAIRELAALPRTSVKLSGLALEAAPGPLLEQARPFVTAALEAFGPDRSMAGSDFPVSAATPDAVPYDDWFAFVGELAGSPADRDAVLRGTALRVYGRRA
ncbi:amidohydrolase family protein [Amnibacterium kyonggiense]|uniref:L-fuconolactonase n=1 Tax=Amnibacterium kyonggiense TaxID=595671 RepID=A0A4R7FQC6_9MICO|nr:amidohydrolase family protein [Amnibacterium kyonggiense]TDS79980.1 L-fuconolactonase [Amnibacterium kyonggiense]